MFDQKDIILIPFPFSDLTGAKQRPALIISNNKLNKTEDRICCLITSNPSKELAEITEKDFKEGNLPFKSFVKPQRIFTVNKKIIKKKICTINDGFHNKLLERINELIKLD